jgi:cathepsin C
MQLRPLLLALGVFVSFAVADNPGFCFYNTTGGHSWVLTESTHSIAPSTDCTDANPKGKSVTVRLDYPDIATADDGRVGFWTMIYAQGFEVRLAGRSYFAFFNYTMAGTVVTNYCDRTFGGWVYDEPEAPGAEPRNWRCFAARRTTPLPPSPNPVVPLDVELAEEVVASDPVFLSQLKRAAKAWTVDPDPEVFRGLTRAQIRAKVGYRTGRNPRLAMPAKAAPKPPLLSDSGIPDEFEWPAEMLGPVRDQGQCGSCYTFGSTNMYNARARIVTAGKFNGLFSPQDIVSCSMLSQGCDGGFPYLVSRYGVSYGIVEEQDFPYASGNGTAPPCSNENPSAKRFRVSNYRYIGGYFGGCSAEGMQRAIMTGGPVAVSFEVTDAFMHYKGGVFVSPAGVKATRSKIFSRPGDDVPFEFTNHVVMVVGWGVDKDSGLPWWRVQNSWSARWGEQGYFRILRSTPNGPKTPVGGELAIEEMAVEADILA